MRRKNIHIYIKAFTIAITCLLIACTPYDSNKVNTDLIQGKWQLVDIKNFDQAQDSILIDYSKDITFLIFDDNTFIQQMPDLKDTLILNFRIHDYHLYLLKDSLTVNKLSIDSLTVEKLVLSQKNDTHIYKRIKE